MTPQGYLDTAIVPAAQNLGIYTLPHLQIGFGTCGQESGFQNIRQIGGGPALGPFQMEPSTHNSLIANFVRYRPHIEDALTKLLGNVQPSIDLLMTNMVYAAMMMFIKYLDCPGEIPDALDGQAEYYVRWYNAGGKATTAEYIANYQSFSAGVNFPSFDGVST